MLLGACAEEKKPTEGPPPAAVLKLSAVDFTDLSGWTEDNPQAALAAFRLGCARWAKQAVDKPVGGQGALAGTVGNWRSVCAQAAAATEARAFFEANFQPFAVSDNGDAEGLFTGYYEPLLQGARVPDATHRYPLYRRPPDLVSVDLGQFDPELEGRRIGGRVEKGKLVPYADRAAIDRGALAGRELELLWVDDPVDRFFLEIQGSGQVRLPTGESVRVGYADQNGRPYRAIGKDLIDNGAIPREQMSMQAIRAWLEENPGQAPAMMARNPSYVFFTELTDLAAASGPLGAQGVPLTPGTLAGRRPQVPAIGCPGLGRHGGTGAGWRTPLAPADGGPGHRRRHPRTGPWRRVLGRRPRGGASGRPYEEPRPTVHPAAPRSLADQLKRPKPLDGLSLAAIKMLHYNIASFGRAPEGPTCCSPAPPRAS